jgi:hypothetical protein
MTEASVSIYNHLGEIIFKNDHAVANSGNAIQIDCRSFAKGIYFLEISKDNFHYRERVVKQ